MPRLDIDAVLDWRGKTVHDAHGEKIGAFGDVFLDSETDTPAWGGVRTGLFGRTENYIPLAAVEAQDGALFVPYASEQVKSAPRIDPDVSLTADEERALYDHYGQEYVNRTSGGGEGGAPLPDGEMVRSEEEVHIEEGPMRPAERVRLRKVLVTTHEKRTIPVRKEDVQLETEPPPEGRIDEVSDAGEAPPPAA